jgi:hypothetical protein
MSSGFSLGAAIGATGKFPKIKVAAEDEGKKDRTAKELAAIKSSLTLGDDLYHNVYVGKMAEQSGDMIQQIIESERNRDPDIVSRAYKMQNNFQKERNYAKNQSQHLFTLQKKLENLDKDNQFAPKPVQDEFLPMLRNATSEEQVFGFLKENPRLFKDGYLRINPNEDGLKGVEVITHDKVDFDDLINDTKLFSRSHLVKINETKNTTDKERTIDRYFSIPRDRLEAQELAKTDNTVTISNNAFDLGKAWFTSRPNVMRQYKSTLYENNQLKDGDPAETDVDELYRMFYRDHIVRAIPKKYENKDQVLPRYQTNVYVNNAQQVAPTSFSVGQTRVAYRGDKQLFSPNTVYVSREADGIELQNASNLYAVSLDTGVPDLAGTATKNFKVSTISLFPCIVTEYTTPTGATRKVLTLLDEDQKKTKDQNGEVYMMMPFAIGTSKSLEIGTLPDVGKRTYAIPLYEPNEEGKFVIPNDIRQAKTIKGSPLLDQIVQRNKWDEMSLSNWTSSYLDVMKGVVDQNDAAAKKAAKKATPAKPVVPKK